ncbi:MAG: BolA family transcriptional regulator [Oscillatoriales cyanobacterium RM1_1_9]|nr:BolA family transcriptional regulator [Oscillatoriales cyanobacterium SM2_3_0]NJO46043.1 BolA family transcriptional regulator [Oscillatoriales cyanobacterium RM2_1_1]NJO71029.1 BolA family transcriptional regulator [Oscillatoriales cyanobacterium RM1_1_9]
MVAIAQVETMIKSELPDAYVQVEDLSGGDHLQAIVVSAQFEGKTLIKQHQMVYKAVQSKMATEEIHALALKTFTPSEWEKAKSVE